MVTSLKSTRGNCFVCHKSMVKTHNNVIIRISHNNTWYFCSAVCEKKWVNNKHRRLD